jgi:hypothetical protein
MYSKNKKDLSVESAQPFVEKYAGAETRKIYAQNNDIARTMR